ncbi:uncharacterized protein SPSK_01330 [Sporothrix schenckii 1099-18]|uniref:Uncharacterized protein n=1 Tax=Sporothrix schenckii 1099-18 TaxID=1397361 RepID=A0A0F2LVC2_SPOSC|nr:uncharacterized protein SPSK_01330 [Sporothrix schenckii 1099-18]KJR81413.1 hypothetical protein SPSK_01330 [Sporothrix schenckii 1099-18]
MFRDDAPILNPHDGETRTTCLPYDRKGKAKQAERQKRQNLVGSGCRQQVQPLTADAFKRVTGFENEAAGEKTLQGEVD